MTEFIGTIVVEDVRGKRSRMQFDLGDFTTGAPGTDYDAAVSAMTQISGALAAVTNGVLREVTLRGIVSEDASPGAGDATERAMINAYLDAAGDKVTQVYIPAPVQGIFLATEGVNYDVVDTADADLIQYVQQLSQHAFVSDGEQINTTVGNGIESGLRVARSLKLGK